MEELEINVTNRDYLIDKLKEDMIGPTLKFSGARELTSDLSDAERNSFFYYHKYNGKEEEISFGGPQRKYNSGMLFPLKTQLDLFEDEEELEKKLENETVELEINDKSDKEASEISEELISQNKYLPSTFGMTFAVSCEEEELKILFECGGYERKLVNQSIQQVDKEENNPWWFRKSLYSEWLVDLNKNNEKFELELHDGLGKTFPGLKIRFDSTVRTVKLSSENKLLKLVTINVTNITENTDHRDPSNIIFQCELKAMNVIHGFKPYPTAASLDARISDEDKKFDLLYSKELNYAFGQNCSTTWKEKFGRVDLIKTTFLPEYEIKTMTPDIKVNGEVIKITHAELASVQTYEELLKIINPLIDGYENWLSDLKKEKILPYYEKVFQGNIKDIEKVIGRLKKGREKLSDSKVFDAFRLTNLAMLMQMVTGRQVRSITSDDGLPTFDIPRNTIFDELNYSSFDTLAESIKLEINKSDEQSIWKQYKWRGFQIAFLIMTLESFIDKESDDRENVDLIWFPTGGGKTEAYLASATFSMIYRRLSNPEDIGTDVIMRYTLRLLTADQFQRSARLICSIDYLRKKFQTKLGKDEISLGMWVGEANTPNKIDDTRVLINQIMKKEKPLFPVTSCPWCGAEMKVSTSGIYYGYDMPNEGLICSCPDRECSFYSNLPIYFIDEQMYRKVPTFIIGTIDKFVQLTWNPEARSFFGIDRKGNRKCSPPNLIIQDELHLISGPLGTLTGMYECLIEELATDRRNGNNIIPKIICATATIKAYEEQINSLYARKSSSLFPPSGIDINDNFFSTVLKDKEGKNARGRKYVGVHPFTQGKLQTEVQTTASLLTSVQELPENQRDPFWTILSFYNSINDIGKGLVLSEQDIPSNMQNYYKNRNIDKKDRRHIKNVKELTSRLDSDKIGFAIDEMKVPYTNKKNNAIDIVLASNIIEVGVDIDRLSLMTINGQPKTSAQYIQVSGRVGRKVDKRPGLVVTEYNPTNSNDKSHYEHFVEFHQKLYAQVEESSVTPFSKFAIERGLPAVIIGFLRQSFDQRRLGKSLDETYVESDEVKEKISLFLDSIVERAKKVDSTELASLRKCAKEILNKLVSNSYESWEYKGGEKTVNGFMVPLTKGKEDVPDEVTRVMFSMRSVDAVAQLSVTPLKNLIQIKSTQDESNDDEKGGWF